ncbi:MAG: hypothetical protein K2K80_05070 [Clostridia bacterium]|nr:hypothetical protein [Clostridia bacterium]
MNILAALLAEEVDLELIIAPCVLGGLVLLIILFTAYTRSYSWVISRMKNSQDRMQKRKILGKYLYKKYYGISGTRKCPVCGKRYSATVRLTDKYGDVYESSDGVRCPRCHAQFTISGSSFHVTGPVKSQYEEKFKTLTQYIATYNPDVPDGGGSNGISGTFIPD